MRKHKGFASVLIFVASALVGVGIVSGLVNTTWIEQARKGEFERDMLLWANTKATADIGALPASYYESAASVIWLDFIMQNVTPMKNMIDFNRDVRRWNTQTKIFARNEAMKTIAVSALNPNEENGYRKYMRKVIDDNTGITWVYPVINKIPDETLHSGLRIREDALKIYLADTQNNNKYFPDEYLTSRNEMAQYYSDSHKQSQDFNLMMPFSIQ